MVNVGVINALLKGAQVYIGGEEAHVNDNDENDNESPIEGDGVQDIPRGMELTVDDFHAL